MAVTLSAHEVSDICLGKPALRSISVSATLAHALSALKRLGENYISVWNCRCHSSKSGSDDDCRCVGKISVVDVISFLCREENLSQPAVALQSSISVLIPEVPVIVRHLEPHARSVILFSITLFIRMYSSSVLNFLSISGLRDISITIHIWRSLRNGNVQFSFTFPLISRLFVKSH